MWAFRVSAQLSVCFKLTRTKKVKLKSVKECCKSEISKTVLQKWKQLLFACEDRLLLLATENWLGQGRVHVQQDAALPWL